MTTYAYYNWNKGTDYQNPFQSVTYSSSVNTGDVVLQVNVTNAGTATGLNVNDVLKGLHQIEQYLLASGVDTLSGPSEVDIVVPGQG